MGRNLGLLHRFLHLGALLRGNFVTPGVDTDWARRISRSLEGPDETLLLLPGGKTRPVGELAHEDVGDPERFMSDTDYVFLSHTGKDGVKDEIARPTYWFLTAVLGVQAFLDEQSPDWGSHITEAVGKAAYRCTHAVVILSPTFREREYCVLELNTFMRRWRNKDGIQVLPILHGIRDVKGYHAEVNNLIRKGSQAMQSGADCMVDDLWPALLRKLKRPAMTKDQLEELLAEYVDKNAGHCQIPACIFSRTSRQRSRRTMGPTRLAWNGRTQAHVENRRVIDAYFAIECYRTSLLSNLVGRPQLLAELDQIRSKMKSQRAILTRSCKIY